MLEEEFPWDNDQGGEIQFGAATYAVTEGATTARITRRIVLFRCSMLSISQRAFRTLLARNSRVFLSCDRSFSHRRYMAEMLSPSLFGGRRLLILRSGQDARKDLVAAAFNDAAHRVETTVAEKMSGMTAGLGLPPGFKLPF